MVQQEHITMGEVKCCKFTDTTTNKVHCEAHLNNHTGHGTTIREALNDLRKKIVNASS